MISRMLQGIGFAGTPALAAFALFMSVPNTQAQTQPPAAVTIEMSCQHLFARLTDTPTAPSWNVRTKALLEYGFTIDQVQMIMNAANGYSASTSRLASQAAAIHQSIKSKSLEQAVGVQQLQSLDQQRDALLTTVFEQLKADLVTDGRYKLDSFLNIVVKPTIKTGN